MIVWLTAPAVVRWVLWPAFRPTVEALTSLVAEGWQWWLVLAIVLAPIVTVVLAFRVFSAVARSILGRRMADRIGNEYAAEVWDWLLGRRRGRPMPRWEPD
jgi:hypothetical protein